LSLAPAAASARAAQRVGKEMRALAAGYSARTADHWHRLQEKPIYLGEQRRVSVPVACAVPSAVLFERPPSGVQISAGDSGLQQSHEQKRMRLPRAREESRWNFFCQPVKFECPITAESWAAIYCPLTTASAQVGKSSAAARSTGLRPIHFIHFIEAAVTHRVPNLPEGIPQSLQNCNAWQDKFLLETLHSVWAFLRSCPQEHCHLQLHQCNAKPLDGPLVRP